MNLIVYKEIAADDKEDDDTRKHLTDTRVETEIGCDLICSLLKEAHEDRGEYHSNRIELGHP